MNREYMYRCPDCGLLRPRPRSSYDDSLESLQSTDTIEMERYSSATVVNILLSPCGCKEDR